MKVRPSVERIPDIPQVLKEMDPCADLHVAKLVAALLQEWTEPRHLLSRMSGMGLLNT